MPSERYTKIAKNLVESTQEFEKLIAKNDGKLSNKARGALLVEIGKAIAQSEDDTPFLGMMPYHEYITPAWIIARQEMAFDPLILSTRGPR